MTRIAFIHPDLGIGGAERLVVDAAAGIQEKGHTVKIYTSHCDLTHCFDEVSSGILDVSVYGDFLPISIAGKFHILCAILRQLFLAITLVVTGEIRKYDFFIVDQLSFCVPILALFGRRDARVLFYCHFPDQLLAKKGSVIKSLYRVPFDAIEEITTGASDRIVVNLTFTKLIFHQTFTRLAAIDPGVVYPCVDVNVNDDDAAVAELRQALGGADFFLSINRFERLKNIELAIKAFADFHKHNQGVKLLVAGGYDHRVSENVEYLDDLKKLCDNLQLVHATVTKDFEKLSDSVSVVFLPSVSTRIKNAALSAAQLLLYTPTFEHFGIVPVEAMLRGTPVLAINKGGPLELVKNYDGSNIIAATGFNRPNEVKEWVDVMRQYYENFSVSDKKALAENGKRRVYLMFSRERMSDAFWKNLQEAARTEKKSRKPAFLIVLVLAAVVGLIYIGTRP